MGATNSSREALGRMGEGVGEIVTAPGDAFIELMTGGSPIKAIQSNTRKGLTDILYGPLRIAKHTAGGLLKGTGKLLWAGLKQLPIFPIWNRERREVGNQTKSELASLRKSVGRKMPKPQAPSIRE